MVPVRGQHAAKTGIASGIFHAVFSDSGYEWDGMVTEQGRDDSDSDF